MSVKKIFDAQEVESRPLTPELWKDFEAFFSPHGVLTGCWCLWWRMTRSEFSKTSGEEKRSCMRAIVESGRVPGILGYLDGEPVAWCSVAPRDEFPSLDRSRTLGRVDDLPVWSMVCFYFGVGYRRSGLMLRMIELGIEYARAKGARVIEAYPIEPRRPVASGEIFMGLSSVFRKAGFIEVARRSPSRPVMRFRV